MSKPLLSVKETDKISGREALIQAMSYSRQPNMTVILENIYDTHNISAVLRTCDAVGIVEIFVLFTEPQYSISRVKLGKRSSAGARKWLDVHFYRDIATCIEAVKKKYNRVLASSLDCSSSSLYDTQLTDPVALVFGNEHSGISTALSRHVDGFFTIPIHGMVQSLNLSVACAISLYEVARQRQEAGMYDHDYEPFLPTRQRLHAQYLIRNSSLQENYHIIYPK